jgi:hypothetical protein
VFHGVVSLRVIFVGLLGCYKIVATETLCLFWKYMTRYTINGMVSDKREHIYLRMACTDRDKIKLAVRIAEAKTMDFRSMGKLLSGRLNPRPLDPYEEALSTL